MRILTVIGARPQFIKAAMVSKAIMAYNKQGSGEIEEIILHTGQHYDSSMSEVFFTQMGIPTPNIQLDCGGGTHGEMTGKMLIGIEKAIFKYSPDWVLIYGDTNSTIAGALAAVKQHVKVAHVEAGLRADDLTLPEEVNRVLSDRISSLLLCPTRNAVRNLAAEGISGNVYHVGDVMYDAALSFGRLAEKGSTVISKLGLKSKSYFLATVHRQENTDDLSRLHAIFGMLNRVSCPDCPIVLPIHPRTEKILKQHNVEVGNIKIIKPVGFLDMVALEKSAKGIMTDSGGVQKEAYFHGVPAITFHYLTAWTETVEHGWNALVDVNPDKFLAAIDAIDNNVVKRTNIIDFGDGHAAEKVVKLLAERSMK